MRRLLAYAWPGNVRELENVIERAVILASGPKLEIGADVLPVNDPLTLPSPDLAGEGGHSPATLGPRKESTSSPFSGRPAGLWEDRAGRPRSSPCTRTHYAAG